MQCYWKWWFGQWECLHSIRFDHDYVARFLLSLSQNHVCMFVKAFVTCTSKMTIYIWSNFKWGSPHKWSPKLMRSKSSGKCLSWHCSNHHQNIRLSIRIFFSFSSSIIIIPFYVFYLIKKYDVEMRLLLYMTYFLILSLSCIPWHLHSLNRPLLLFYSVCIWSKFILDVSLSSREETILYSLLCQNKYEKQCKYWSRKSRDENEKQEESKHESVNGVLQTDGKERSGRMRMRSWRRWRETSSIRDPLRNNLVGNVCPRNILFCVKLGVLWMFHVFDVYNRIQTGYYRDHRKN